MEPEETSIVMQRLSKQVSMAMDMQATTHELLGNFNGAYYLIPLERNGRKIKGICSPLL
jgi:hypothetical protein